MLPKLVPTKDMRIGSVTFCYPFIQKIIQNLPSYIILSIMKCFVVLSKDLLNEGVAEGDTSDPHDFSPHLTYITLKITLSFKKNHICNTTNTLNWLVMATLQLVQN